MKVLNRVLIDTNAIEHLRNGHVEYELQPISTSDMVSGELKELIDNYNPEEHENDELISALVVLLTKLGAFADSPNSPFLAALVPVKQRINKKDTQNSKSKTSSSTFWSSFERIHYTTR